MRLKMKLEKNALDAIISHAKNDRFFLANKTKESIIDFCTEQILQSLLTVKREMNRKSVFGVEYANMCLEKAVFYNAVICRIVDGMAAPAGYFKDEVSRFLDELGYKEVEIDEASKKSLNDMFEDIFKDPGKSDHGFEKELDETVECISNQRWGYFKNEKVKKEVYVKAGTIKTSRMGEHDFTIKISYERAEGRIKNGLVSIAFDCGFLKYSFENKSCILQEIAGKVDGNIKSYKPLLYDLPNEILIEMGF